MNEGLKQKTCGEHRTGRFANSFLGMPCSAVLFSHLCSQIDTHIPATVSDIDAFWCYKCGRCCASRICNLNQLVTAPSQIPATV